MRSATLNPLTIRPYRLSLLTYYLNYIRCSLRAGVFAVRPALVCQWVGVHKMTLFMSSSFSRNTQHVSLVILGWFVRWEVSSCTATFVVGAASNICSKQHIEFGCSSHLVFFFFFKRFVRGQEAHLYSSSVMAIAWKKSSFILSETSDFSVIPSWQKQFMLFLSVYWHHFQ